MSSGAARGGHPRAPARPASGSGSLPSVTLATMLNYLDRSVMSVAKPSMASELQISAATMGFIFSAFSWTYAFAQILAELFSIASAFG